MDECNICHNKNNLRKCINCNNIYCYNCLYNYYKNNNLKCQFCGKFQNFDEYIPIYYSECYSNINELNSSEYDFDDINIQKFCFECQLIFEKNNENIHYNHHYISLNQMTLFNLNKVSNILKEFIDFKNLIELLIKEFDNLNKINKKLELFQLEQIEKLKQYISDYFKKNNSLLNKEKQKVIQIYQNYRNIDLILDNIKKYVNQNLANSVSSEIENIKNQIYYFKNDKKIILDIKNKILNSKPLYFKFNFQELNINNNMNSNFMENNLDNIKFSSNFKEEKVELYISQLKENKIIIQSNIINNKDNKDDIYNFYFQGCNYTKNKFFNLPLAFDIHKNTFQEIVEKNIFNDLLNKNDYIKFYFLIIKLHYLWEEFL